MARNIVVLILFVITVIAGARSANILSIHPYPGPSQYIVVQPFLKALAARGHNLTVINAFPQKTKIENFHDIPILEILQMGGTLDLMEFALKKQSKWADIKMFSEYSTILSTTVLSNPQVQKELFNSKPNFDLIIVEALNVDPLYGFAQHFNAPIIGISTFGADNCVDDLMDNSSPLAYVPSVTSAFTDHMSYWERLQNVIDFVMEYSFLQFFHLPNQVSIYKQYFPDAAVDLMDLRKNFSLMLLNQHFSLSFARPYVPNMIEVGGWHISYKPSPLPEDMAKFLNESKEGVIYFSLGSNLRSKDLPKEKLDIIMRVFAKLPLRVMWKYEDPNLPGKPDNVYIAKWFPQPDILAHPNVKLFITHGGLISSIESIYHGKPIVGIPFFYDQFLNVQRAQRNGYGDGLHISTLTEENLSEIIKRILENSIYTKVAQDMSNRLRDQPQNPLEKAIFWTEYVIRHKGAPHMRVAAQRLNFIQRHSLDTIGTLVLGALLVLFVFVYVVRKLVFAMLYSKYEKLKSQ